MENREYIKGYREMIIEKYKNGKLSREQIKKMREENIDYMIQEVLHLEEKSIKRQLENDSPIVVSVNMGKPQKKEESAGYKEESAKFILGETKERRLVLLSIPLSYHIDIAKWWESIQPNEKIEILGGGRIYFDDKKREIIVGDHSHSFGSEPRNSLTIPILESFFGDYEIKGGHDKDKKKTEDEGIKVGNFIEKRKQIIENIRSEKEREEKQKEEIRNLLEKEPEKALELFSKSTQIVSEFPKLLENIGIEFSEKIASLFEKKEKCYEGPMFKGYRMPETTKEKIEEVENIEKGYSSIIKLLEKNNFLEISEELKFIEKFVSVSKEVSLDDEVKKELFEKTKDLFIKNKKFRSYDRGNMDRIIIPGECEWNFIKGIYFHYFDIKELERNYPRIFKDDKWQEMSEEDKSLFKVFIEKVKNLKKSMAYANSEARKSYPTEILFDKTLNLVVSSMSQEEKRDVFCEFVNSRKNEFHSNESEVYRDYSDPVYCSRCDALEKLSKICNVFWERKSHPNVFTKIEKNH
jgi:hypothetical protein